MHDGIVIPSLPRVHLTNSHGDNWRERVQLLCPLHFGFRFRKPVQARQKHAIPLMGCWIIWIQINRPLELLLGRNPVPVVGLTHHGQRGVGFGERVIQGKSFLRGGASLRKRIARRHLSPIIEQVVTVGQAGVRNSVSRIDFNGLLKQVDGAQKALSAPEIPEEPSLQIQLIAFRRRAVTAANLLLLVAGEPNPQLRPNVLRELLLKGKDICNSAIVLLTP